MERMSENRFGARSAQARRQRCILFCETALRVVEGRAVKLNDHVRRAARSIFQRSHDWTVQRIGLDEDLLGVAQARHHLAR